MPRGGKRDGAGRRKNGPEQPESLQAPNKAFATEVLDGLKLTDAEWKLKGHPDTGPENDRNPCQCEACLWRRDAQQPGAEGQPARRYLWDRRDGKPTQRSVVNHLHDKPVEHLHTFTLSERFRIAIEKGEKRVRDGR